MPPADLDFYVKTDFRDGRTRLTYLLQSPSGKAVFTYREVPGPTILGRPEDFQAYLINKLGKLGDGYDVDGSYLLDPDIERKLAKMGRDLYLDLFPPEMRQVYREIRYHEVRTIRIVSDEPWIPWELIKPYDDSRPGQIVDDEFLCLEFELTRWLAGDRSPRPEIRVRRLACIVTAGDLPKAEEEKGILADLAEAWPGVEDASPSLSSAPEAEAFLEAGGVDLLHFAGHGTFKASQPNESGLPFINGSALRPQDLQGPLGTRIGQDRPLVFLNACWSGQQGWSFTRLGGWADRWVRICGCGAFVAPMWPVRDSLALEFAKSFYAALADGATFGQAARQARANVRKLNPSDPSWLAYSVYGDVNGRLLLGDSTSERRWQEPGVPEALPEVRNRILSFGRLIERKTEGRQSAIITDIFISYAHADHAAVQPLAASLRALGWTVWWDESIRPGEFFPAVIDKALQESRCVVALWSRQSVESMWVRTEAAEGLRRRVLIPVWIEDVDAPLEFRTIQTIDLVGWKPGTSHEGFDKLIFHISRIVGAPLQAVPLVYGGAEPIKGSAVKIPAKADSVHLHKSDTIAVPPLAVGNRRWRFFWLYSAIILLAILVAVLAIVFRRF